MGNGDIQPEKQGAHEVVLDELHKKFSPDKDDVHEVVLDERHGQYIGREELKQHTPEQDFRNLFREASEAIAAKHQQVGGGPARGDVVAQDDGLGFYQVYGDGAIYWRKDLGAAALYGVIYTRYLGMGATSSFLGYPTADQKVETDGIGFSANLEHGSIYSTQGTAFEVHGAILDEWLRTDGSQGWLGYPTSDEYDDGQGGQRSNFENGRVWAGHGVAGAHTEPQWLMYEYAPIVFGTGLAIGGHATLYLFANGQTLFQGHLHDSGAASYTTQVTMAAVTDGTQKHAIVFTHIGQANGDLSVDGSPDDDWEDWKFSQDVFDLWTSLKDGSSWHGAALVDGYVVFGKIVQILSELWDAAMSDGSKGENENGETVKASLGPSGEESFPSAALRMN